MEREKKRMSEKIKTVGKSVFLEPETSQFTLASFLVPQSIRFHRCH